MYGTDTWIGSTDAAAMLRFTGVHSALYDVHSATSLESKDRHHTAGPGGPETWPQRGCVSPPPTCVPV